MNEWEDAKENSDEQFNTYATVLTRVKGRLDTDIAMAEEVKKFGRFEANIMIYIFLIISQKIREIR